MEPSTTRMNGSTPPSAAKWKRLRKSSPFSKERKGLWKLTLGIQGMPPNTTSSILGCVAAVMAMVSPSHPRPAVIQRTSISAIGGAGRVEVATGLLCKRAPTRGSGAGTIFLRKVELGKGETDVNDGLH